MLGSLAEYGDEGDSALDLTVLLLQADVQTSTFGTNC